MHLLDTKGLSFVLVQSDKLGTTLVSGNEGQLCLKPRSDCSALSFTCTK